MGIGGWIVIAVVVLLVVWLVFTYNRLVTARNRTQEAWSEIDVELKRRHDLIPNLVNTVQGYMGHERGTLEAVTNARAAAVAAGATGDPAKIGQAENMLSQSLRHRRQDRVLAPLLQRQRARLQHLAADPPHVADRRGARLQGVRLLPGGRGRPRGAVGELQPGPRRRRPAASFWTFRPSADDGLVRTSDPVAITGRGFAGAPRE